MQLTRPHMQLSYFHPFCCAAAESIPVPDTVSLTSIGGSSFPGAAGGAFAQKNCNNDLEFSLSPWFSAQPPAATQTADGSRKKILLSLCGFCSGEYFPADGHWLQGPRWLWCSWPARSPVLTSGQFAGFAERGQESFLCVFQL